MEVVEAAILMMAIKKVKPLIVCQSIELTVYLNLNQEIIIRISFSTTTKHASRIINIPTLYQTLGVMGNTSAPVTVNRMDLDKRFLSQNLETIKCIT